MTSWRRTPLPPDWGSRRRAVLARDPVCRICGVAPSVEVDHAGQGDDHRLEMLRGVCAPCHAKRSKVQAAEGRRRNGRKREPERHPGLLPRGDSPPSAMDALKSAWGMDPSPGLEIFIGGLSKPPSIQVPGDCGVGGSGPDRRHPYRIEQPCSRIATPGSGTP